MDQRKKRILYITCFGSLKGGGQRSLYLLIKYLSKERFEPYLIVPQDDLLKKEAESLGIKTFVLPFPRIRNLRLLAIFGALRNLYKIVRQEGIDLISTDSVRETVYAGIVAKFSRIRLLLHLRVTDSRPWVDWLLYSLTDKMIAVSLAVAERFKNIDKNKKIEVVYNGVELDVFKPSVCPQEAAFIKIGYFGRLEERKGIDLFIKAFGIAGLPDSQAYIFGDGENKYVQELKSLSKNGNIFFRSFQPDICAQMAKMDVIVLPSRYGEGLSRAMLEAMAMGKPVLASDIPSNPEVMGGRLAGLLFENGNEYSLASLIRQIAENKGWRIEITQIARTRAEQLFDIRTNTKAIQEIYLRILEEIGTGITSKNYDDNIRQEGLAFQMEHFYEPKSLPLLRRFKLVMDYLSVRPGEKFLDIGCGVGGFSFRAARSGAYSCGIDYSYESVKTARLLTARYKLDKTPVFLRANACALPFRDRVFDKIVSADFIEHIYLSEKDKLLEEIKRVMKDGGRAVIFTPNKVREDIGEMYWRSRRFLFNDRVPKNELHYGLITRGGFEALLKKQGLFFELHYQDTTRPYLAKLPFLNRILSLNLLWVIYKHPAAL